MRPHGTLGWLIAVSFAAPAAFAQALPPDAALAGRWTAVCAGAPVGSDLAARCGEIFAGGPGSTAAAAAGNFLAEVPGQGRVATRDGAPDDGLRQALGNGWSVFLNAEGGDLRRRDGINEASFDGDAQRFSAGVDWAPSATWRAGLLLNHARDDLDFLLSDGRLRTRFTGVIAVAGWNATDALAIDAYAGRLDGDYDIRRAISYSLPAGATVRANASASPEAERELAGAGVTWSTATGAWEWQLGAGIDWQRTSIDPYSERGGAGLAIAVPGRAVVSRRGRVDATLSRTLSTSWGVWQPMATLGWRHEYANPTRPVRITFVQDAGAAPVVFSTDDADRDWAEAGLGAVFVFTGGHSAFVEVRQRFGHDFLQERLLSVGWRIELP